MLFFLPCKGVGENTRVGKTRDLFKKTGEMNGIHSARMGMIKDRNGKELTEAEQIKKRWARIQRPIKKNKAILSRITWLSGHHVLHPKTNLYAYVLGGLDFVKPFLIWKCHFLLLSYFQLKAECVRLRLHSHCPVALSWPHPPPRPCGTTASLPPELGGVSFYPPPNIPQGPHSALP